jgi:acetyl-CoA carboxylase biotin carboxyl carrier protein
MAKKKVEKTVSSILGVATRSFENYLKFFNKNNLKELTVREHGAVISLKRDEAMQVQQFVMPQNAGQQAVPGGQTSAPSAGKQPVPAAAEDKHEKITSPIIGTFYEAASPGSPPFIKEGQSVNKGDTLCIVEAMKVMNKVTADFACKIIKKIKSNGDPVKTGETLFLIEK